jgi:hypothetical protein
MGQRPKQQFPWPLKFEVYYFNIDITSMQRAQLWNFLNSQLECVVACYTFWTAAWSNQHVLSLWEFKFQWAGQAPSSKFQLFKMEGSYLQLAQPEFQCNVRTFETFLTSLWSVLGPASPYAQLQEAIRTARSLWKLQQAGQAPLVFPLPLQIWGIVRHSMNVWVQHCKAMCAS